MSRLHGHDDPKQWHVAAAPYCQLYQTRHGGVADIRRVYLNSALVREVYM